MNDTLIYFKDTYEESRSSFLDLVQKSGGDLKTHKIDAEYSFDSLYLPAKSGKKDRLLILSSGVHGIEGFTGSALQRYYLENLHHPDQAVLIIHGINAYGFKHKRRVTQNNVDLNRNFDISAELFKTDNPGYASVRAFLNPAKPYNRFSFHALAIMNILRYGMENLRKAILRGQYQFPDGIFFGGKEFEPQVNLIKAEVERVGAGYKSVLLVDLHTGYGQRGKLHLFGDRSHFIDQGYMNKVFKGLSVDYGQEKDFYSVTGGFTVFMSMLFHQKAHFAGICFEFGTIDSHKTKGSLDSLYRMINEKSERNLYEEMFYPSSPEWRKAVVEQFNKALSVTLSNWKSHDER